MGGIINERSLKNLKVLQNEYMQTFILLYLLIYFIFLNKLINKIFASI